MEHIILIFKDQRRLIAKPPSYEVLVQLSRAYFGISPTDGLSLRYFPLVGSEHEGLDLQPDGFAAVADCTYITLTVLGPLVFGTGLFADIPVRAKTPDPHQMIPELSYTEDDSCIYTPATSDVSYNDVQTPRAVAAFLESHAGLTRGDIQLDGYFGHDYRNSHLKREQGSEHDSDQGDSWGSRYDFEQASEPCSDQDNGWGGSYDSEQGFDTFSDRDNGWGGDYESEQASETRSDPDNGWGGDYDEACTDPFIEHSQTRNESTSTNLGPPPHDSDDLVPYVVDNRVSVPSSSQNCGWGGTAWSNNQHVNWQATPSADPNSFVSRGWHAVSGGSGNSGGLRSDLHSGIAETGTHNDHSRPVCEPHNHRDGFVCLRVYGKDALPMRTFSGTI